MISHKHKCIFAHIPKNAGTSVESAFGFSDIYHKGTAKHSPIWCYQGHWSERVKFREYPLETHRMWVDPKGFQDPSYAKNMDAYTKFAIVRNPWDRLHSTWKYDRKLLTGEFKDLVAKESSESSVKWLKTRREWYSDFVDKAGDTFSDFVKNVNVNWFGLLGRRTWCNLDIEKNYPEGYPKYHWIKWHQYSQLTFLVDVNNNVLVDNILRFENLSEDWEKFCNKHKLNLTLPHINASTGDSYKFDYTPELVDIVRRRYVNDIEYFKYEF